MVDKKADMRVGAKVVQMAVRTAVPLVVLKVEPTAALTAEHWVALRVARWAVR